jgi:hypothetical protein
VPTLTEHPTLLRILPDACERARYQDALHRLCMGELPVTKLARRASLAHRLEDVRRALRADARFEKVHAHGPERYRLRAEHRHATTLRFHVSTTTEANEA